MGILTPQCVASDGTTIYAYARTNKYDGPLDIFGKTAMDHNVLIKSNYNPANINDITWTLVDASNASSYDITPASGFRLTCTVNTKGIFTVFRTYYGDSIDVGLQFTPATAQTPAIWKNVTADTTFNRDQFTGCLHTFNDAATGFETIMFTRYENLNEAYRSGTLSSNGTWMSADTPWKADERVYGRPIHMAGIAENRLITYGSYGSNDKVTTFSFQSASSGSYPSGITMTVANASIIGNTCKDPGHSLFTFSRSSYTVFHCKSSVPSIPDQLYLYNGGPEVIPLAKFSGHDPVNQIGGVAVGTTSPYAVIFYGGYNGPTYGITLNGTLTGNMTTAKTNFKIEDPYGEKPLVSPTPVKSSPSPVKSGPSEDESKSGDGSNVGMIVGIITGLAVAVLGGFIFVRQKRRRRRQMLQAASEGGAQHITPPPVKDTINGPLSQYYPPQPHEFQQGLQRLQQQNFGSLLAYTLCLRDIPSSRSLCPIPTTVRQR
ncbi:hypothetical protein BGZ93_010888 [Podila epicladia]|nr:hypothetical protein BGZ93_010888 [Podila epicladia]